MTHLLVRPAPGRRVRDPITLRVLDEAGEYKPADSYWLRKLAAGDVVKAEQTDEAAELAETKEE